MNSHFISEILLLVQHVVLLLLTDRHMLNYEKCDLVVPPPLYQIKIYSTKETQSTAFTGVGSAIRRLAMKFQSVLSFGHLHYPLFTRNLENSQNLTGFA